MTKFSIIIPIYGNVGENLNRCVDSLLAQTVRDFEIIISGSKVMDEQEKIINNIKIKNININTNSLGKLMNEAFKISNGEFIHVWQPDLVVYPDYLQCINEYLLKYGDNNLYAGHLVDTRATQRKIDNLDDGIYFKLPDYAEGYCCLHRRYFEPFREEFEGSATHWCQEFLFRLWKKMKFICMNDIDVVHIPHVMRTSYQESVKSSQKSSELYEAMKRGV